jgi:hypothetical protein
VPTARAVRLADVLTLVDYSLERAKRPGTDFSAIGWVQCVGVTMLFTRRMLGEECHLRATFPGHYDAYIQRTGRVLPKW